jgi:hypothetical protein
MIFIVNSHVDDQNSVYVGREGVEVELCYVLYLENHVGWEIETFCLVLVDLPIRHVNPLP